MSQSFTWLQRNPSAVHPSPALPRRSRSFRKLSIPSLSLMPLSVLPKRTKSARKLDNASSDAPSPSPSPLSKQFSWMSLGQGSVHPTPAAASHPQAEAKLKKHGGPLASSFLPIGISKTAPQSQLPTSARSVTEPAAGQHSMLTKSSITALPRAKGILRPQTSVVPPSIFDSGLRLSSSDEEGSLAVPEDLIESALFLLRDKTLANHYSEVRSIARPFYVVMHDCRCIAADVATSMHCRAASGA